MPEKLAERVSRHLVMAGLLMQDDPETAYKHALAARARASRNGLIREACGETAYAAGKFAEALSEFRAARRMNGQQYYAPMMADCERALGRPEKALAYDTPDLRAKLDDAGQIELSIVVAGARRDLGQVEAALRLLETEPLHSKSRAEWVARLRYAYADTLLDAGRARTPSSGSTVSSPSTATRSRTPRSGSRRWPEDPQGCAPVTAVNTQHRGRLVRGGRRPAGSRHEP